MVPGRPPQQGVRVGAPGADLGEGPALSTPLLLAAVPLAALLVAVASRAPRRLLLCAYAGSLPFGSGVTVPIPAPPPFNTLTTLLGLGTLGAFLLGLVDDRGQARRVPMVAPAALFLLAAFGATYAWSIDRAATFDALLVLGSLVALFVVVSVARLDDADLSWLRVAIIGGGVLGCAYGAFLLVTGRLPEEAAGVARFSTAGGVGDDADPNITAATLVLPFVLALAGTLEWRGIRRLAAGASAAVIAAGILLTASRGGVVGAVAAVVVLVLVRRPSLRSVAVGLAGLAVVAVLASTLAPDQFDRLTRPGSSGRTNVWELGLIACEAHCSFGSGLGTYIDVHEHTYFHEPSADGPRASLKAHNIWLQAGVETGIAGVVAVLAVFVALIAQLHRLPSAERAPPLAAIAGLLVTNAFLGNLSFKYFWLVLLYGAIATAVEPRTEPRPDPAARVLASAGRFAWPAAAVGVAVAAGVFVTSGGGTTSFRATATVLASRSPEVTEVGIDEAVEAVFDAHVGNGAELRADAGAVSYAVVANGADRRAAATAANRAANRLVRSFNAEPVAFIELVAAQPARPELARRVGGPAPPATRLAEATVVGTVAGLVLALALGVVAHRAAPTGRLGSARDRRRPSLAT